MKTDKVRERHLLTQMDLLSLRIMNALPSLGDLAMGQALRILHTAIQRTNLEQKIGIQR